MCASLLTCCLQAAPKDLSIASQDVFAGASVVGEGPLRVTLGNVGEDAEGSLIVESQQGRIEYPVTLPRGSKKVLTVYPPSSEYGSSLRLSLDTDQGDISTVHAQSTTYGGAYGTGGILHVGDGIGQLGFMQTASGASSDLLIMDSYMRPEWAPERPLAYRSMGVILLGEGSERLSDAGLVAIKRWTLLGGKLVIMGGASAPIIRDSRIGDLLPVRDLSGRNVRAPRQFANMGGSPVEGTVSVMSGQLTDGAKSLSSTPDGTILVASRSFGLGTVYYFAFSPVEPPINRWQGRKKLLLNVLDLRHSAGGLVAQLNTYAADPQDQMGYGYAAGYGAQPQDSPFRADLPETAVIVFILLAYVGLVVPANLLILRSKHKGEWAWLTAPLISLAFAGIFFSFAGKLYSAGLSVAPRGVLIFDTKADYAYFYGMSRIFFPRGGTYDLRLQNVDYIAPGNLLDSHYYGATSEQEVRKFANLNPTDDGEIRIERAAVTNLAFHQFLFGQAMASPKLTCNLAVHENETGYKVSGSITNNSPLSLIAPRLKYKGHAASLATIEPGETVDVSLNLIPYSQQNYYDYQEPDRNQLTLEGELNGVVPGPQIGKVEVSETTVQFIGVISDAKVGGDVESR